jgi:hypothetical protein
MAYDDWLHDLPNQAHITNSGARIALWLYVYPDGHGVVQYVRPDGRGGLEQPVNHVEEALNVLRDVWDRASRLHD